jgi:hypothetical protein
MGFCSHTEQINHHIDRFRDSNKEALDRNTNAIKEQTEQQKIDAESLRQTIDKQTEQQKVDAESLRQTIDKQTEQQKIDAESLRQTIDEQTEQQKADAEAGRNVFSDWMNNLVSRIKFIFSKDTKDNETSYYEMMESEQHRMQEYVAAHTSTVKSNADTTNAKLQSIISELQKIQTNDDENANAIKNAINNLDLVVNNTVNVPRQ